MATVTDKIAYAKGLKDGLSLQDAGAAKLFEAVLDALDAIAETLGDHDEDIESMDECLEDIYDELEALDEFICEICEDEDDDDEDDGFMDDWEDEADGYDAQEGDVIGIVCPGCGEDVALDMDVFRTGVEVECPNCGHVLFNDENEG